MRTYRVDGVEYVMTPAEEAAETAREAAQAPIIQRVAIENAFSKAVSDAAQGRTDAELNALRDLYREVREYTLDNTVSTPGIDEIVLETGNTKTAVMTSIRNKAQAYQKAVGRAYAIRDKALANLP